MTRWKVEAEALRTSQNRRQQEGTLAAVRVDPAVGSFLQGRWQSLQAAVAGVRYTLRTQPNAWIEVAAVVVVVIAGVWFRIRLVEWALLTLTFGLILALEAMNTAVETVVDLVSPQYHPLARIAKDAAAGALLIAVMASLGVAGFLFGPRLWALLAG
uniref:Diacylglycerol kinase family protein n=1 Tax=Litorilinea aerophila TaxID=1204385 RepID=A0A540VFB9_9CHLR